VTVAGYGFLRFADRFAKLEKTGAAPFFRREVQSQVNQRSFLGELSLYDRARRMFLARALPFIKSAGEALW
jgi:hypothetical protein